jgi:hypothetical protein
VSDKKLYQDIGSVGFSSTPKRKSPGKCRGFPAAVAGMA